MEGLAYYLKRARDEAEPVEKPADRPIKSRSPRSPDRRERYSQRSRSPSRDRYRSRRERSPANGHREYDRDRAPPPQRSIEDRQASKESMMNNIRDSSQQDRRVYVGNLPYEIKWHALKDFMKSGKFH